MKYLIIWLVIINIIAFAMAGIDKRRARKHQWRISEKALFGAALIGGSVGLYAGMQVFRHKTKHWYFVIGVPAIIVAQAAIIIWFGFIK